MLSHQELSQTDAKHEFFPNPHLPSYAAGPLSEERNLTVTIGLRLAN
jgi:hypothetical protein